jgi:GNAT superfamily N-acetyltransferase
MRKTPGWIQLLNRTMLSGMAKAKNKSDSPFDAKGDSVEVQLAAAVELNTAEWLRLKGGLPWVELHDEPDILWIFAGDTYPQNSAALARFTAATAHRRIGEILARHLERRVSCNWIVGPISQPTELPRHLRNHGFSCRIHCAGMACDLRAFGEAPAPSKDAIVELVEAPRPLFPLTTERRKRRHEGRAFFANLQPKVVWNFSATVDGKPVGETTLLAINGSAGLYDVEVLEKYRRRGIGSALIHAALSQAKSLGYDNVVLGATGIASGVYARLGFREVCKLSFWKYGKMRQLF